MKKGARTLEGWMLENGKPDDHFYTHKKDKDITAFASFYCRKVHTERLILVDGQKSKPNASAITKVTIIE